MQSSALILHSGLLLDPVKGWIAHIKVDKAGFPMPAVFAFVSRHTIWALARPQVCDDSEDSVAWGKTRHIASWQMHLKRIANFALCTLSCPASPQSTLLVSDHHE